MAYDDILYEATDGIAWITINRPKVLNAFRAQTVDELIHAFKAAWHDASVGVCVLTGTGDARFSTGGDQSERDRRRLRRRRRHRPRHARSPRRPCARSRSRSSRW
jgi:1,4-dihydroxy-2-naphthoyl-CoA synthase